MLAIQGGNLRKTRLKSGEERIFLIGDFYDKGNSLLLYSKKEDKYHAFKSFLESGIKRSEMCVYVYPKDSEKLSFERSLSAAEVKHIPIADEKSKRIKKEDVLKLASKLEELYARAKSEKTPGLRVQLDFGEMLSKDNLQQVLELERKLHEYNGVPTATLSAFHLNSVDQATVRQLAGMHSRTVISPKEGETSVSLAQPQLEGEVFSELPPIHVVSAESMEQCVKKSLDYIVLSLLQQKPMCGFDVIKTIVQRFNVLLSQGTVYPILYSLQARGYLITELAPDNKTRVYASTEAGREYMKNKIREYIIAQEHILNLIVRGL